MADRRKDYKSSPAGARRPPSSAAKKAVKKRAQAETSRERAASAAREKESVRAQKKSYRARRNSLIYLSFALLAAAAAAILAVSVFFTVREIEVRGTSRYSDDEIIAASGVQTGDNLLLMDKFAMTDRMLGQLIWVESVEIRRVLPDRLRITVTEAEPAYAFEWEDGYWISDRYGRLLEYTPDPEAARTVVYGAGLVKPQSGQIYTASEEAALPLAELLAALEKYPLQETVTSISLEKIYDTSFEAGPFSVNLGRSGDFEEKVRSVALVIAQLKTEGSAGAAIDMAGGTAHVTDK